MATSPYPLIWSFYRAVEGAEGLGGVAHFYDETSQSIWLSSGIKTNLADVPNGHWKSAEIQDTIDVGTPAYTLLELDHAYNGVLFGAATIGSELVFLRYLYAMDCSDLVSSGSIGYNNSNAVAQLKFNLLNSNGTIFSDDATVFQPGAKVTLKLVTGSDAPYDMCIAFLDSVDYSVNANTIPVSGRNNVGFKLMESTFDDMTSISGLPHEVVAKIFEVAGIESFVIEPGTDSRTHEFRSSQTLIDGVKQLCEFYHGWKMVELPNGTVVVGYPSFVKNYAPNGYYVFDAGDVFKRKTKRSSDSSYTKVMVTGRDVDNNDLKPVILPVNNYSMWKLPKNKTYHETAPDGLTQEELQTYAENLAESIQYVGVGEDFTGCLQPHLIIGDVAAVDNGDDSMTVLGIVTSINHSFGRSGFKTDFSTDSGGILMETLSSGDDVVTLTKPLNGYNRKQTLKDLIQVASGSSAAGPKASGTTVKVVSSSNAATLEGKTYEQIVQAAAAAVPDELPDYTEADYGKALVPGEKGLVWQKISADAEDIIDDAVDAAVEAALEAVQDIGVGTYVAPNIINYAYEHSSGSTSHSRTYNGTVGNRLLLLVLTRGEIATAPEGWTQLGILTEAGDKDAGSVTYSQYVTVFTKMCTGTETINYAQTENNMSITCVVEFEGVSGFEILENTRQENIATSSTCFACSRTSTRMAIWIATAIYFLNDTYTWDKSDSTIWAISDNQSNIQPRLGVFVDNRPSPIDFTFGTNMSGRYASALCIQIIPIKGEEQT